jgi:hypothetical protein
MGCREADISSINFVRFYPLNRTKVFHVKRFGTIDTLRKCTFTKRREVRCGDLGQARFWDNIKLWTCDF